MNKDETIKIKFLSRIGALFVALLVVGAVFCLGGGCICQERTLYTFV